MEGSRLRVEVFHREIDFGAYAFDGDAVLAVGEVEFARGTRFEEAEFTDGVGHRESDSFGFVALDAMEVEFDFGEFFAGEGQGPGRTSGDVSFAAANDEACEKQAGDDCF